MSSAQEGLLTVGTLRLYGRADWDRPFLQHTVTHSHTPSQQYNNSHQIFVLVEFAGLIDAKIEHIQARKHLAENPDTPSRRQLMLTLAADSSTLDGRYI